MMRYLLPLVMLAGCGPIPVQVSKQSQEQSQTASQTASQAADQQSSHASESRQGTNSMPVIIICNTVSSPNGHCIAPNESGPLTEAVRQGMGGAKK
jgi:hypothetical protein